MALSRSRRCFVRLHGPNMHFDKGLPDAKLLEDLWIKHCNQPSQQSKQLIIDLRAYRSVILSKCLEDPAGLLQWLYENQGVRRFDASNRLFLVLVDQASIFDSWKLKRTKPLHTERIHSYLDAVPLTPDGCEFQWEGKTYSALADVVFVVHPSGRPATSDQPLPTDTGSVGSHD